MILDKKELLDFGMVEADEGSRPFYLYNKDLTEKNEDGYCLSLRLTNMFNNLSFVLVIPGGGMVFLDIASIEELRLLENMIHSFVPNY